MRIEMVPRGSEEGSCRVADEFFLESQAPEIALSGTLSLLGAGGDALRLCVNFLIARRQVTKVLP